MKILVATQNQNKINEIKKILENENIEIISLKDLEDNTEVIEDGKTFYENAFIKASYFFNKYKIPTIADDSGLCIDVLNGAPGIYSARYSGLGDSGNIDKVLKEMNNVTNRNAHFKSVIVYIDSNSNIRSFEGILIGEISFDKKGNNGFGYDPIFYLNEYDKHLAELNIDEKNIISHRHKALNKFKEYLNENINNK